jgi:hypothetical protein
MIHGTISPESATFLAQKLAEILFAFPGLLDELMDRKHTSAREVAMLDVNEFLFSARSPLSRADRITVLDMATTMAEAAVSEPTSNVIRISTLRLRKPKP